MITVKIALRSLLRRKVRMAMIGLLVFLGTLLIVLGETFALSARYYSARTIIDYFTGDLVLYSKQSRAKPSPFSFTTPLPLIANSPQVLAWLDTLSLVESHVAIAQNYGIIAVEKNGVSRDLPFIFYAVEPSAYARTFKTVEIQTGSFFDVGSAGPSSGVVLSAFQVENYAKNYNVDLAVGDKVTLLSVGDAGSVNAYPSSVVGTYRPTRYRNVFDYINFIDITSYSLLYNFTGVEGSSLPRQFNDALGMQSDDDIFGLAQDTLEAIETGSLVAREISGYSIIAVKLVNSGDAERFAAALAGTNFEVATATWQESSGFFAYTATVIQGVIYAGAFLVFLIVIFILMNTLIINVLERTAEIGTLRALGGEKGFIRAVFLWESFLLNGTAALLAIVTSLAVILVVGRTDGIMLPDVVQQYLVGGGTLPLRLMVRPFVEGVAIILVVALLSTLYPIRVATSITPLKAMANN